MAEPSFTIIEGGEAVDLDHARGLERARRAQAEARPVALDLDEHAACVGVTAAERARQLTSLEAPDFTLPDLEGRLHSLAAQRGRKVLLVAYASW